jgi:hypothetical protein
MVGNCAGLYICRQVRGSDADSRDHGSAWIGDSAAHCACNGLRKDWRQTEQQSERLQDTKHPRMACAKRTQTLISQETANDPHPVLLENFSVVDLWNSELSMAHRQDPHRHSARTWGTNWSKFP